MKPFASTRSRKTRLNVNRAASDQPKYRWKRWVFGIPISLVLPIFLLVRLSTWLYLENGMNGWVAIGVSVVVSGIVIAVVVGVIANKIGIRPGRWILHMVSVMMSVSATYLLVFISAANVKSVDLKETYIHLHPVLRVAISTFIVLDAEAVLTDTERRPDDYARMGVDARATSLHFEQVDGYIHAVDLRTIGRSRGRNFLTKMYFEGMGFATFRHIGTADHLHISLPVR